MQNETHSIYRGSVIEMPSSSSVATYFGWQDNTNMQVMNTTNDEVNDDEFDDSDKDPNYHPSHSSFDETELEEMGQQVEEHLAQASKAITNIEDTRATRKRKRNSGQSYVTGNHKLIKERTFSALKDCRRKCASKIPIEHQIQIFDNYWKLGEYNSRLLFVSGLIEVKNTKTKTLVKSQTSPRNRIHTTVYHLEINKQREQVCQNCFRTVLGKINRFLKTGINQRLHSDPTKIIDNRGKHTPKHKLSEEKIKEIKDHINLFPAYESHYSRNRSAQKYLHADLTITKMFELYSDKTSDPVSISKYREVFLTMGIKFKKPKVDTCNKCDTFTSKLRYANENEKADLVIKQKNHHEQADFAYQCKANDKTLAETNNKMIVATFDLQQCLPTPFLQTSVSFYKRQLWTFNLTVHNCGSNVPYCFLWNETIARRGGNEIASCVFQYLKYLPANIEHVVFYSDSCPGQNKNAFVAVMLHISVICSQNLNIIDHKFLETGHTHMECDIDHALIERKKRNTSYKIHHPRDWSQFIRTLTTKTKFIVHDMIREEFFNFAFLVKNKFNWRHVDKEGNRFKWKNVKWLRYSKEFGSIQYKTFLNEAEPFKTLNIRKRGYNEINLKDLILCYSDEQKISSEKKRDLLDLLPLIDPAFHNLYENLKTVNGANDVHPNVDSEDEVSSEEDD